MQIGPANKIFRTKNDVKVYFEENGELEYDTSTYDFSLHKKRAKDMGLCVFTDAYKKELNNRKSLATKAQEIQLMDNLFCCPEAGCNKKFRKENQLQIHIRHSHNELAEQLGLCAGVSDEEYQHIVNEPVQQSIPKIEIPAAGRLPAAVYSTSNPEYADQFDTFYISYVDSKYD